jgi:hypothetical protein
MYGICTHLREHGDLHFLPTHHIPEAGGGTGVGSMNGEQRRRSGGGGILLEFPTNERREVRSEQLTLLCN